MSEKIVLSYFNDHEAADRAAHKLTEFGVASVRVERIMEHEGATLVTEDVRQSEIYDGTLDVVNGRDILLTAFVEEYDYPKAVEIVRSAGGIL